MTSDDKKKPQAGSVGRLRYKIWTNHDKDGRLRYAVDIYRSFRVENPKAGEAAGWRESHSFSEDDLKLFPVLLDEVTQYLATQRPA